MEAVRKVGQEHSLLVVEVGHDSWLRADLLSRKSDVGR
jgi:hypothetical protein